jgi:hypothetical protein
MLTPLDSAIFDDDVVEEMESRFDEVLPCKRCSTEAKVLLITRCCKLRGVLCEVHAKEYRAECEIVLKRSFGGVRCPHCENRFENFAQFEDVVRVVEL